MAKNSVLFPFLSSVDLSKNDAKFDAERQVKPCMRLLGELNALILATLIFISFWLSLHLQGL